MTPMSIFTSYGEYIVSLDADGQKKNAERGKTNEVRSPIKKLTERWHNGTSGRDPERKKLFPEIPRHS